MQESGAKRPAKLPQRESDEENDRADTLSDACQEGEADGDVPAHLSKTTNPAEVPELAQDAPLTINNPIERVYSYLYNTVLYMVPTPGRANAAAVHLEFTCGM